MRRLRLELRQTMDMYSAACKEALSAKQKVLRAEISFKHIKSSSNRPSKIKPNNVSL